MWTCIAHAGYFVLCAVLLTFLRCPGFSRATLLLVVPLNAAAELNQQPALDLTGLSLLLLTLSLGTDPALLARRNVTPSILSRIGQKWFFRVCRSLVCESVVGMFPDQGKAGRPVATGPVGHCGATEGASSILPLISTILYATEVSLQTRLQLINIYIEPDGFVYRTETENC